MHARARGRRATTRNAPGSMRSPARFAWWLRTICGMTTVARETSGTAIWNGPLGKFEDEPFNKGTHAVAEAMAQSKTVTIVGGGETAEAVEDLGLDAKMKHVSTGGGAFLEYIEGTPFAALAQIEDV